MWLEEFLRRSRAKKVLKYIKPGSILCDIGCGPDAYLLNLVKLRLEKGIGIDKKIESGFQGNLEFINLKLEKQIPLSSESVDLVTMLAILEHLSSGEIILKECFRILKRGGRLIITTPAPAAEPILSFLAYKLKLLSREEIREHVNYFSLPQMRELLEKIGFSLIKAKKFQFGFNIFILAQKK